jgi:2-isopropylmalate synthase
MNGYGERCGNVNLASVIANLELKLHHTTIGTEKLAGLAGVCRFIAELANLPLRNDQPFVGKSAFAHKGGVHVSAVLKDSATYEHIKPELVGNRQRVLVSDLSGRGNIIYKLKQHGLADRLEENTRRELLERIKQMEYEGYELEAAEGTFELLVRESTSKVTKSPPGRPEALPFPPPPSPSRPRTIFTPSPNPVTAPSTPCTFACASAFPSSIRKSPTSA